jgi:hypothetical protein
VGKAGRTNKLLLKLRFKLSSYFALAASYKLERLPHIWEFFQLLFFFTSQMFYSMSFGRKQFIRQIFDQQMAIIW